MKLFLLDGHALIFKMYYAFLGRPMVNSKGEDTSVIFGFTKYLLELISKERPEAIAVAFDPPGGTFRNKLYPAYKANRPETPKLVIDALEPLTAIVKALGIPVLMTPGYEADDVIGSAAKQNARNGCNVYMVTPDKDYGQLVEEHILQYKPGKGKETGEVLGVKEICEKYSISSPLQVIDILTLCGDTADNVPGVQGVGPVGAAKLLAKYGSVENIYSHIGELSSRQQEAFRAAEPHIALSKTLVTIKTDIPIPLSANQMHRSPSIGPEILQWLDRYEMPSLRKALSNIWTIETPSVTESVAEEGDLFAPPASGREVREMSFRELTDEIRHNAFCGMALEGDTVALAVPEGGALLSAEQAAPILGDESVTKCGYDLKHTIKALDAKGINLRGKLLDTMILHYLLNSEGSHEESLLFEQYLGVKLEETAASEDIFSSTATQSSSDALIRKAALECSLSRILLDKVVSLSEGKLYDDIEEPLIGVLARMEEAGVLVDLSVLQDFAAGLRRRIASIETRVRKEAGEPGLNLSSPKQVGELLFGKLKIAPEAKKPFRGSWPTDEETLLKYSDRTPLIEEILEYRGSRKLLSTYIEPFPEYVSPLDGRIHTSFNQALTSTGRLSSSNPNLQNIPIRTEEGKEIRRAFKAPEGSVIMSADYSQIELRLMAHYCGDEHMREAFLSGTDVHSAMAAKIFHKKLEDVTPADRRVAKTANFGIMYGISSFGLAARLHISRSEASDIIRDYYASFPSIRAFIDRTLSQARANGYVQTLFGRRRYVSDVNSHNATVRAMAERNAVNAPIQGSAADIIKLAMNGVDAALREGRFRSRMVLQIHDELVLEVPRDEISAVRELLVSKMEGAVKLSVPLTVECNYGNNWLEAHE